MVPPKLRPVPEEHAELFHQGYPVLLRRHPQYGQFSVCRLQHACQQLHGGALAGSVGACVGDELPLPNPEGDMVKGSHRLLLLPENAPLFAFSGSAFLSLPPRKRLAHCLQTDHRASFSCHVVRNGGRPEHIC